MQGWPERPYTCLLLDRPDEASKPVGLGAAPPTLQLYVNAAAAPPFTSPALGPPEQQLSSSRGTGSQQWRWQE